MRACIFTFNSTSPALICVHLRHDGDKNAHEETCINFDETARRIKHPIQLIHALFNNFTTSIIHPGKKKKLQADLALEIDRNLLSTKL